MAEKRKSPKAVKARRIILGILLIVFAVILICAGLSEPEPQLLPQEDVYNGEEWSNDVYEFTDVLVIDCYATTTYEKPTNPDEAYYVVAFFTEDSETAYLASLCVDEGSKAMYSYLEEYYNNDELEIGDCYINMCVSKMSLDAEISEYYDDAARYCTESFDNVEESGINLNFEFENADEFPDYVKSLKTNKILMLAISVLMLAAGIFLLVLGFKKPKEQELQPQENSAEYYVPQAQSTPNTDGNGYYQPQENAEKSVYYVPPVNVRGNDYSQKD